MTFMELSDPFRARFEQRYFGSPILLSDFPPHRKYLSPFRGRIVKHKFGSPFCSQRIGSELVQYRKNAVIAECNADGTGAVEKQNVRGLPQFAYQVEYRLASDMSESMWMNNSEILSRE